MWGLELEKWYQFLSHKTVTFKSSPYQVCGPSHDSVGTVWSCGLLTLPHWHGVNSGVHIDLSLKLGSLFVYGSLRRQRVDGGCGWTLTIMRRPFISFPPVIIHYTRRPGIRRSFIQVTFITCPFTATSLKRNKTRSWEKKAAIWGLPEVQEESTMMVVCTRCWGHTGVVSLTWHRWPEGVASLPSTPDSTHCKWKN